MTSAPATDNLKLCACAVAFAAERSVELAEAGLELVPQDEHATITTRPIHRPSAPVLSITPWCTNAASPAHPGSGDSSTAPALHEPRDRHILRGLTIRPDRQAARRDLQPSSDRRLDCSADTRPRQPARL